MKSPQIALMLLSFIIAYLLFILPIIDLKSEETVKEDNMILIPAGEFTMGSDERAPDEKPAHKVYLEAYYIDRFEVTNEQYYQFWIKAQAYRPESFSEEHGIGGIGKWPDRALKHPKQPVIGVSWHDAVAYANWAGKRLPTESEWEKAARGSTDNYWAWGSSLTGVYANTWDGNDGYDNTLAPVGSYPKGASPHGVMDMTGNVWEWVADWYSDTYYYQSPKQNPKGPKLGVWRVIRGGSWVDKINRCTTTIRLNFYPNLKPSFIGFRLAKDSMRR